MVGKRTRARGREEIDVKDFEDQVVIVTGASSGIGRATALAFAREGATVVVADRDVDRLAAFLIPMNERAGRARSKQIREKVRSLGAAPFKGRQGPRPDLRELVMRFGRSSYVARYQVTDEAVIVLRIWHGLEDRPSA